MEFNMFDEDDHVFLVGEGNFSFSVALFQLNLKINITATCYEPVVDKELGKKNIEYLQNNGVRVLLGVDATNLKEHPILNVEMFDKIIFNFPHTGGKMRIEKNRELLKKFFLSASESLKNNGLVIVTLCNGQGGTLIDNPPRRWEDSWKITEMAAHGDFVLKTVQPFAWSSFENYIVTGYRGLDKQFHSDGALTHIFRKSESPNRHNIAPKMKIDISQCNSSDVTWADITKIASTSHTYKSNIYGHVYTFDITLNIMGKFEPVQFYIVLYNYAGVIVNDTNFIYSYKPSENTERRTYRISYKSDCLPLFRKRVIDIHQNLIARILEENLNVSIPR